MTTKTLTQSYFFEADPDLIYNLLMDKDNHTDFTGSKADIQDKVGTVFTTWDGYIQGENLELIPGEKIVQLWRAEEEEWPENHFSHLTITLVSKDEGTELNLAQTEIPEKCLNDIKQGWIDFYWEPLEQYLSSL